jgi:NADPH:quinone reductase-like Zn-dependent oxidoreductase
VVESIGGGVADFKPGDAVFGGRGGAFAEYVTVRRALAPKPARLTFEEAAAVPTAGITALQGLRDHGRIQPGQKVLINGASGGVGTFAIQVARAYGAEVTAVCSTRNVECARSLGAHHVIDYTRQDFTRSSQRYDLLFDVAGSQPWSACRRVLEPDATVVLVGGPRTPGIGPLSHVIRMRLGSLRSSQQVKFFIASFTREDMLVLKELLESGKVKPFVERTYPLANIADAMGHIGAGHARGKIVVTMG